MVLASLIETQPPSWVKSIGASYFCLKATSRLQYPLAVARLARLLRREKVDILQTHLFEAGLIGVLAARLARIPIVVVTRHHTDEVEMVGTRLHGFLDRFTARTADAVVGFSHAVRNRMMKREHIKGDKIKVIYQGFDYRELTATEEDRQRIRSEFGFESNFVIGYVARFYKTKGHDYLLIALSKLVREIPEIRLLLLGGGDKSSAVSMVREYGLEDKVVFAGHRKDVSACMRAMDVVIHPSLTEAFCQAHIEAMASGSPLVATNVAAAPEVISHGETGLLIPPADPNAIVEAILRLYNDPKLRQRIAEAGQESVRRRFTIERMVSTQLECYQHWLGRSSETDTSYVTAQT